MAIQSTTEKKTVLINNKTVTYIVEKVFLGEITADEMIDSIIQNHINSIDDAELDSIAI